MPIEDFGEAPIVLYDYWRSTSCYRVRIALNIKAIGYQARPIDLLAGEELSSTHLQRNPQGFVPVLEIDNCRLTQSLAIIEYLDATYPTPPLLPPDIKATHRVRAIAHLIAMDIHPVCNLRVVNEAVLISNGDDETRRRWMQRFITGGFTALESLLLDGLSGDYSHGNTITLADICLVPQVYNARRWGVDMSLYPTIERIEKNCLSIEAFHKAQPVKHQS